MSGEGLSWDGLATIIAAAVAVALGVVGVVTQRRIHKREYTLQVLSHLLTTDQIIDGRNVLRRLRNAGRSLSAETASDAEMDRVNAALQFYEFIANAYFRGDLDREAVLNQLAGSYLLTQRVIRDHVAYSRKAFERPDLFAAIERMAEHVAARDEP